MDGDVVIKLEKFRNHVSKMLCFVGMYGATLGIEKTLQISAGPTLATKCGKRENQHGKYQYKPSEIATQGQRRMTLLDAAGFNGRHRKNRGKNSETRPAK